MRSKAGLADRGHLVTQEGWKRAFLPLQTSTMNG
jgi:hypothetical protein